MKILVVCQYYYPEPFRITDICESLVQKGHSITVLTGLPNYPEGKVQNSYRFFRNRNEIVNGVNIKRCFLFGRGKSKLSLFLNYLSFSITGIMKSLFMSKDFDVIFANQLSPITMVFPAIVMKWRTKKKLFLYCLDLWPDSLRMGGLGESSLIYKFFYMISKYIYTNSDLISVTSHSFIEYLTKHHNITDEKINHIPQYAEDLFTKQVDKLSLSGKNFVFAGNIGEAQSVETIIKAANILKDKSDVSFHIVGDGTKLNDIRKLVEEYSLTNVSFYGRRPLNEMTHFYGIADAMLVTLKSDDFLSLTLPGKVQTYMAAGKPIIGAINGETDYVIRQSNCGYCGPAEDYEELARNISLFCCNTEVDNFGKNSKKYYRDKFEKSKILSLIESNLLRMVKGNV
jgi:glycosyltransferase involved in cell wall biosynthesis